MTPDQLYAIRRQLNMTQEEFAEWRGVSRNTVSRWERGKRKMSRGDAELLRRDLLEYARGVK